MVQGGYAWNILRFNPMDQTANEEELPPKIVKDFIESAELEIKDLSDELKTGRAPLGSNRKPSFSAADFSGTAIQCANRMAVSAKSPFSYIIDIVLSRIDFPHEKNSGIWVLNLLLSHNP
jgi:aldehyde:ferredoxin oxidoreductase